MRRSALLTASAFIGLASIVAAGTTASASARTTIAPKVAGDSSFTINLLGTPITVGVTTDPAGNLVNAALNPVAGFTATTVQPNKVVFDNTAAGTQVRIKANHGGQSVTARAADLTAFAAGNNWTGDVFGTGGTATIVAFDVATVAGDPTQPDITNIVVTPGGTPPVTSVTSAVTHGNDDEDNQGTEASVSVKFSSQGQTRTLRIMVGTHTGEDGVTHASLRMSLSKIRGTLDDGLPVVGPHTFTATLCAGTPATIGYAVAADGTITVTAAAGQTVTTGEHGVQVSFATGEVIRISVKSEDSSTMKISIKSNLHCVAPLPQVNGAVVPAAGNPGGHGDHGGHGGGNGGGDNKGNG